MFLLQTGYFQLLGLGHHCHKNSTLFENNGQISFLRSVALFKNVNENTTLRTMSLKCDICTYLLMYVFEQRSDQEYGKLL